MSCDNSDKSSRKRSVWVCDHPIFCCCCCVLLLLFLFFFILTCNVCHGKFAFPLDVIGRICSVIVALLELLIQKYIEHIAQSLK